MPNRSMEGVSWFGVKEELLRIVGVRDVGRVGMGRGRHNGMVVVKEWYLLS